MNITTTSHLVLNNQQKQNNAEKISNHNLYSCQSELLAECMSAKFICHAFEMVGVAISMLIYFSIFVHLARWCNTNAEAFNSYSWWCQWFTMMVSILFQIVIVQFIFDINCCRIELKLITNLWIRQRTIVDGTFFG